MEYRTGQLVRSKAGRDKGTEYLVIRAEGNYIYVADGKTRRLERLKKKKIKHVQGSYEISDEIVECLENGTLEDHMIRRILARRSS